MNISQLKSKTDIMHRDKFFPQYDLPFQELECVTTEHGRHYVSPNGVKLTSVTTMLGRSSDHGWLDDWRERLGHEAADAETMRCAMRGEGVHLSCEYYLKNYAMDKVVLASGEYVFLFRQLKPHLNNISHVLVQEIALYSEILGLAGRVDCICVYRGQLCILDFKTSNGLKTRGMIEDYSIQLCLYSVMFEQMFGKRIDKLVNIIANEGVLNATVIEFDRKDVLSKMFDRIRLYRKMDLERNGIWN